MTAIPTKTRFTISEYLAMERDSRDKHEYRDGQVLMMAGGSADHSLIAANVLRLIGNALVGKPCHVYESNLRVRIARKVLYTYPDATVICGQRQHDPSDPSGQTIANPRLIVEVLSESTEGYDRGDKFRWYQEIESLQEYVLVSQNISRVETFLRQDGASWLLRFFEGHDAAARLESIDVELPLREVYAGVELSPAAEDSNSLSS